MTEILSPDYPERDAIEVRAYEIWQRRGCPQGTALQDWCEAEAQLRDERRERLEATRLFEPPVPVEIAPPATHTPKSVLSANGPSTEAPAKRRRRTTTATRPAGVAASVSAAAKLAGTGTGTRVTRKRPARPDA